MGLVVKQARPWRSEDKRMGLATATEVLSGMKYKDRGYLSEMKMMDSKTCCCRVENPNAKTGLFKNRPPTHVGAK